MIGDNEKERERDLEREGGRESQRGIETERRCNMQKILIVQTYKSHRYTQTHRNMVTYTVDRDTHAHLKIEKQRYIQICM